MISFGDMLDTLEKNELQKESTVEEKKGGGNEPEKEKLKTDEPEDVI